MIGLIQNTNEEYHSGPGVSVGDLKLLDEKSPLHLWQRKFAPDRVVEQTEVQMIGSAIHCALLEPDQFPYRYAVIPEGITRRSNIGRDLFRELAQEGKQALTQEQYDMVKSVADAASRLPVVRYLLSRGGASEQSIYWIDRETGVLCRMRPDYMIEPCAEFPNGLIFDAKSAEDASPEGFRKASYNYRYHQQAAWYQDGFKRTYGTAEPPPFLFGAFEKEPPFAGKVYPASANQIALGAQLNRRALLRYAECERTGVWPGYSNELTPLGLPPWGENELRSLQAPA